MNNDDVDDLLSSIEKETTKTKVIIPEKIPVMITLKENSDYEKFLLDYINDNGVKPTNMKETSDYNTFKLLVASYIDDKGVIVL